MHNAAVLQPQLDNPTFHVLGVRFDAVQIAGAVTRMERLISSGKPGCYVAVTGMHGVAKSRSEFRFKEILNAPVLGVNESAADVLWVGLSTPKQEKWMHEHRNALRTPLMLGVGAAFDMNSGRLRRAPEWIREHGLEWLFRLVMEPRRLWRRYLVT